ncbi:hypothetical protein POVWA2_052560 [Plasmodium ovale wallikeri]|uniref:Uncharacterized protein n=1 Tax=Plasmodium ovale wallikeri TaxID=864142 RepID=A0A1A8ZS33_PLAOA|nr:hypothetical protein POVWA1_053290 [Plasmodium ovale wallikeri]SBT46692.1 hypothetical protein POVWA2_052560 [Plasmodium ovale wallikeri]
MCLCVCARACVSVQLRHASLAYNKISRLTHVNLLISKLSTEVDCHTVRLFPTPTSNTSVAIAYEHTGLSL